MLFGGAVDDRITNSCNVGTAAAISLNTSSFGCIKAQGERVSCCRYCCIIELVELLAT